MMRSLFSGVSGLQNHQIGMDVIGANISNVNTIGYKGGRTNFSDIISQTMQGAAAATGTKGGTNAKQVGLGSSVASVDTVMNSGSLQSTGKQTDLAVQGSGFFILSDGLNQYYSRAGNFDFDTQGNFVVPGTGMKVMGWVADASGVIDTGGTVTAIQIPAGVTMPAVATTKLTFGNNLSASDKVGASAQASMDVYDSLGNVQTLGQKFTKIDATTNKWIAKASLTDNTIATANALTEISFDTAGKVSTVKQVSPGYTPTATYKPTLKLKDGLQLDSTVGSSHTISGVTLIDLTGEAKQYDIRFVSTSATTWTYDIFPAGTTAGAVQTGTATAPAAPATDYTFLDSSAAATNLVTMTNLVGVTPSLGAFSAEVNVGTIDLSIPSFQLDNTTGSVHDAYYTVFDNGLKTHVLKMEFTHTANNTWSYKLTNSSDTAATALLSGTVTWTGAAYVYTPSFSSEISVGTGADTTKITLADPAAAAQLAPSGTSFNADCASTYVTSTTVNPFTFTATGAAQSAITLDVSGLTQYGSSSTVQASEQDGYAAGSLDITTIDTSGVIVGKFSNGRTQNLGQVALATFNNPSGLVRIGNTMFTKSNNSGNPAVGTSGTGGRGGINPGNLEMSNIDLATQFSQMIITQRGFQANSKVITTSDTMLEELINLKR